MTGQFLDLSATASWAVTYCGSCIGSATNWLRTLSLSSNDSNVWNTRFIHRYATGNEQKHLCTERSNWLANFARKLRGNLEIGQMDGLSTNTIRLEDESEIRGFASFTKKTHLTIAMKNRDRSEHRSHPNILFEINRLGSIEWPLLSTKLVIWTPNRNSLQIYAQRKSTGRPLSKSKRCHERKKT